MERERGGWEERSKYLYVGNYLIELIFIVGLGRINYALCDWSRDGLRRRIFEYNSFSERYNTQRVRRRWYTMAEWKQKMEEKPSSN